ncbi:long-chain fatty acid transporter permease [Hymenobacter gummosus]|uniref:Long-chain fatty acid transporter permease n=1 Tax=Hymenobacter gummosus TaxID=1776032 RepID=A0A3S0JHM3_9BACT|nr:outer membrane protein transport protein [Hymenobacter gummosus]RTQ53665.1 long-chain fatty acid transporter permease [Hymenobacter gummosus]
MNLKNLLLAGGALLGATAAQAGGFQVTLAGQKNNGMGGVGTGLALDQASMFYNPGALAMVRERGVQIGVNATMARQVFRAEAAQYYNTDRQLDNTVTTPFNLYAGFGPQEGKWKAGIAVYTPFGSKLDYGYNWEGRFALTEIDLKSVFVQPTVSYAITDKLSVGAGLVVFALGSVNLQRDIPVQNNTNGQYGHIELDGKADQKLGFNAGVYFKPTDKLSVGVSYRSKIDATVKGGDVTFSNLPNSEVIASRFAASKFDVTIPLPATTNLGIGFMPSEKLTLGLDVNYTQWSAYKQLEFTFDQPVNGSNTSSSVRDYKDSFTFRVGGQYQVTDGLTVRAGGSYDLSPVKDGYVTPETPDANRIGGTVGLSYKFGEHFGVDLSTQFVSLQKRTQTQAELVANGNTDRVAGTYKTQIVIPGIGLNYTF